MNVSHPIPGAPRRRASRASGAGLDSLEPAAAMRFRMALACLFVSYALAWIEVPLEFAVVAPGAAATAGLSPLFAAIVARVLLGVLYLCVALRHAWARWTAVALGLLSALFVAPTLPAEWQMFPLATLVTGLGVCGKLAAALLLIWPLHVRQAAQ